MEPAEQLSQISQIIAPPSIQMGRDELGDLARAIRDIIEDKS